MQWSLERIRLTRCASAERSLQEKLMSLTFAVADLHGRFDLLLAAEQAIAARAGGNAATVVTLGDYVDKGLHSAELLDRLIRGFDGPQRWIHLKGNHDVIMQDALRDPAELPRWMRNSGATTLRSYDPSSAGVPKPSIVPADHRAFLERLPSMHVDRHRVFVHAGVDPALPLDQQDHATLLWKNYAEGDASGHGARHVVHGHHPFRDGPRLFAGRSNLDTLAWSTGRLVIAVFDDDVAGGPIDLIEVIGPPLEAG
jgi:serine/threonine protein phosphatase 1